MRIRLSTLALVVIAAALIANALLGVTYFQQHRERESLASQLSAARESLREYGSAANLEERLAAAEARLKAEEALFPKELGNAATLNDVLQLAQDSQIKIVDMKTQPKRDENRGNHTYSALSVQLQVVGSLPELQAFLNKLERGALKAVSIDEISITGMKESPAGSLGFSIWSRR